MRRAVFQDPEFAVTVTVDMPEALFSQFKDKAAELAPDEAEQKVQAKLRELIADLASYTIDST